MKREAPPARRCASRFVAGAMLAVFLLGAGCGGSDETPRKAGAPEIASITQMLIAYRSELTAKDASITRSKLEAHDLAFTLLERLRKGESLTKLLGAYTDDRGPDGRPFNDGVYLILRGAGALSIVQRAVFATARGSLCEEPIDTGFAYLIYRRDA